MTITEGCSIIGAVSVVVGGITFVVTRLTSKPQCGDHVRVVKDIEDLRKTDERFIAKLESMQSEQRKTDEKMFGRFDQMKDLIISKMS